MAYYPRKEYANLVDVQKVFPPRYYSAVLKQKTKTVEVYHVYDAMGDYVHTAIVRIKANA